MINISIKSVRGTAPMTTQQPDKFVKVLKADRWEYTQLISQVLSVTMGLFLITFCGNFIFNLQSQRSYYEKFKGLFIRSREDLG